MISLVPTLICLTGQLCCSLPVLHLFACVCDCFCCVTAFTFPQQWILICVLIMCVCVAVKDGPMFPTGFVLFQAHLMERDWMTPPWPQLAQEWALLDSAALIVSWPRGNLFSYCLSFCQKYFPLSSERSDSHLLSLSWRLPQEQTEKKDQSAVTTSNSLNTTAGEPETKQRRKWVDIIVCVLLRGWCFKTGLDGSAL